MTEPLARRVIRTPDQRLRVFVSSTLQELRPERMAAKEAISALHLSPVMFELGARPHPPRELYRAYLEQSHIFVGIYWQRYGWVAPGEEISGLEDEYQLCGDRPKLVYVKTPAPQREDRLKTMLKHLQSGDTTSYRPFETAEELQQLLADDLALMLTETFEESLHPGVVQLTPESVTVTERPRLPRPARALIGRERELDELTALVDRPEVRLVTLLGAGGIGKSRLAIALGERLSERAEPLPTTFVDLSRITDPAQVVTAVAERLGIAEQEGRSRLETLTAALSTTSAALILDNFEQVLTAGPGLSAALEECPDLVVIVTSRTPLRLAVEYTYPLEPLSVPAPRTGAGEHDGADRVDERTVGSSVEEVQAVASAASVQLFLARAQAVRPSFRLTADNAATVAELTRRLDGLPLALELAAARAKVLSPAALLKRLDRRFDLLDAGARDLPGRQQTLRATIDWSVQLLRPSQQRTLAELAVFAGGWSLDAAEAVCDPDGSTDFLEDLAVLVDDNLVVAFDGAQEGRFRMLQSIRDYAAEGLEAFDAQQRDAVRARHAGYFLALAEQTPDELNGPRQPAWLVRLDVEEDNLRRALGWYRDHPAGTALARMASSLTRFWWVRGHLSEGRTWLSAALEQTPADDPLTERVCNGLGTLAYVQGDHAAATDFWQRSLQAAQRQGEDRLIASAMDNLSIVATEQGDLSRAEELLTDALALHRRGGRAAEAGPSLVNLAVVLMHRGDWATAASRLGEAVRLFRAASDQWRLATALVNLGDARLGGGEPGAAAKAYLDGLSTARELADQETFAYAFEGLAAAAARSGDHIRAAELWGAADAVRSSIGTPRPAASVLVVTDDLAQVRQALGEQEFARWTGHGRGADIGSLIERLLDRAVAG